MANYSDESSRNQGQKKRNHWGKSWNSVPCRTHSCSGVINKSNKAKNILWAFLTEKMSGMFHFSVFSCVPWPFCLPSRAGWDQGRIPLFLHISNKMSASSYLHLFIASDVRSRTKVDLLSDPDCRHLTVVSSKFAACLAHILCWRPTFFLSSPDIYESP